MIWKKIKYILLFVFIILGIYSAVIIVYFGKNLQPIVIEQLNKTINTKIDVNSISISPFKHFPKVSIIFHETVVYGSDGDTLASVEETGFNFNVWDIIQKKYQIKAIVLKNGKINIKDNNYQIFKPINSDTTSSLSVYLNKIKLQNITVSYQDNNQKHLIVFDDFEAGGYFSKNKTEIALLGKINVEEMSINGIKYLTDNELNLKVKALKKADSIFIANSQIQTGEKLKFDFSGLYVLNTQHIDFKLKDENTDIKTLTDKIPEPFNSFTRNYEITGKANYEILINGKFAESRSPSVKVFFKIHDGKVKNKNSGISLNQLTLQGYFDNGKWHSAGSSVIQIDLLKGVFNNDTILAQFSYANFNHPKINLSLEAQGNVKNPIAFLSLDTIFNMQGKYRLKFKGNAQFNNINNITPKEIAQAKTYGFLEIHNARLQHKNQEFNQLKVASEFINNNLKIKEFSGKWQQHSWKITGVLKNIIGQILLNESMHIGGYLKASALPVESLLSTNTQSSGNLTFNLPKKISYNLHIQTDTLLFQRFISFQNNIRFFMDSVKISIPELNGIFFNGNHQLSALILKKNDNFHTKISIQAENASIKEMFYQTYNFGQDFITHENLNGSVSYEGIIEGAFDKHLNIDTSSISSKIHMTVENGILQNFEPLTEVADQINENKILRKIIKTEELKKELKNIQFEKIENTFSIVKSQIIIPQMTVSTNRFKLYAQGKHLFNNYFNYTLKLYFSDLLLKDPNERKFPVEINLKGNPEDFDVKITPKIKETLSQEVEKEKNEIKSALKEELNLFKNDTSITPAYQPVKKIEYDIEWEEDDSHKNKQPSGEQINSGKKSLFKSNKPKKTNSDDFFKESEDF
jgi:hypothetical protein